MKEDNQQKKFVCENPKCQKEHDGKYGSGRFCSEHCKQQFISNKPGKIHKCKYCGSEFETSSKLGLHVRCCKQNPNWQKIIQKGLDTRRKSFNAKNPLIHVKLTCRECGNYYELDVRKNQFENGDYKHFCSSRCAHTYSSKHVNKENISIGLRTSTKKHIIQCCRCGKDIEVVGSIGISLCNECKIESGVNISGKCLICGKDTIKNRKTCCKEHEMQLRILSFKKTQQKYHRCGGMRDRGGYGKQGWYNGYHCDSSWELAWVIYQLDQGITFKRNTKDKFPYKFEGKIYNYYPDFILSDGTYVEIKGYDSKKWKAKLKAFPQDLNLVVLYKNDNWVVD